MAAKKRNPQDSTRRNVKASSRRDAMLLANIRRLSLRVKKLEDTLDTLALLAKSPDFAVSQRQMGYKHSTSAPHQIRVK
jgi:hypothetical protein